MKIEIIFHLTIRVQFVSAPDATIRIEDVIGNRESFSHSWLWPASNEFTAEEPKIVSGTSKVESRVQYADLNYRFDTAQEAYKKATSATAHLDHLYKKWIELAPDSGGIVTITTEIKTTE